MLDPTDLPGLFADLVDIESVSGNEAELSDAIAAVLNSCPPLEVHRSGTALVARTNTGATRRVVIAGHLDTVPVAANLPSRWVETPHGPCLYGRGAADMKGGIAVMLHLAATLPRPRHDITWVFYDHEEVAADLNGLARLVREAPELLAGDLALLMEPTSAHIEGGCQGTMRFEITTHGTKAHSARSWLGHNAIFEMIDVLDAARSFETGPVTVDGLVYREGLNATLISGGIAGNVIPDECTVQINYRFAPHRSAASAQELMQQLFAPHELHVLDLSPGARPGLDDPLVREFAAAVGGPVGPKYGWTDVARFTELGIPALNYGPADAGKAHADDEFAPLADLELCADTLQRWLAA